MQATFCATLVDEWVRCGLTDAVVAPGSRSTPLVNALAADGRLRIHVVLDERSAGFLALGLGLTTGRPAPVVTTSGTAAVELHPAVVEAHHAGVPLLAVTADRPPELHGVGAPQTIEQVGLYGGVLRWQADPGVPVEATAPAWRSLAARAVAEATAGVRGPGPVHLNLAFRDPLVADPGPLPPGRPGGEPWHRVQRGGPGADGDAVGEVGEAILGARRGLVVAGPGTGDPDAVVGLAKALGWPLLADPLSGCRVPWAGTIASADSLLRTPAAAGLRPDVVIRLGRPWASKVLAGWLAGLGPQTCQVLVDPAGAWADPDRVAAAVVAVDPGRWSRQVDALVGSSRRAAVDRSWFGWWSGAEAAAQAALDGVLAGHSRLTEPAVARGVVHGFPAGGALMVSSSMPVRDVEWYGRPRTGLRFLANRGANGIDGVLSTAVGVALGHRGPVGCLLGDLAFCYDAGALLGAGRRDMDCTVVVVDNDGGGIFSFLPQARLEPSRFELLWGTPHGVDLAAIAAAYRVPVTEVSASPALGAAVAAAGTGRGLRVVIVRTDRAANVAVHDELNRAVAAAVEGL